MADLAKGEFSKLCENVMIKNKEAFLSFHKDKDRLNYFLWKFTDLKMYAKLQHVIKIVLILSHGQTQVERGFRSNKSLIDDNMSTDTIVALRSVHDYLMFHELRAHEVEMTKDVLGSYRQARKKHFDNQQSKTLSAEKTEKVEARSKVNEYIEIVNTELQNTLSVIDNLKKSSDEIGFRAAKRTALG